MHEQTGLILPDWPAPSNVQALSTTRLSFQHSAKRDSLAQGYDRFNLALHVGDDTQHVLQNRQRLSEHLQLAAEDLLWLEQVHGTHIAAAELDFADIQNLPVIADACISRTPRKVCTVMTADCLPVLFCNIKQNNLADQVAAAHAGWRGLAEGILTATLSQFSVPNKVIAWLGPAISQKHFEVGPEVYQAFVKKDPDNKAAFLVSPSSTMDKPKWLADLYLLAHKELKQAGVAAVYGGGYCTYAEESRFYSYRRQGKQSGRIASLIALK